MIKEIKQIFASYEMNVSGQYLSTDNEVGYVIIDLDKKYNKEVMNALKKIENTIKFRVLY